MHIIGPILISTSLYSAQSQQDYYWCYIELNEEDTVLKFSLAPFLLSDTKIPESFTTYNAVPGVLYVFDPSLGLYFVLIITLEHTILKFRPVDVPLNFTLLMGETFLSGGYTPKFPVINAPIYCSDGCQALYNELHRNQELLSCIKAQYQAISEDFGWNIEQQEIKGESNLSTLAKAALVKNGFLLALSYLKSEAKTPLIYCYAIATIILKKPIRERFTRQLSADEDFIQQIQQLGRYMVDKTLYDSLYPLNGDLFAEIKSLCLSEINKYKNIASSDDAILAIKADDFMSFTELSEEYNSESSDIDFLENKYFRMLTRQDPIPNTLDEVRSCLLVLNKDESLITALNERFDLHFDTNTFKIELNLLKQRISAMQKSLFKCYIQKLIDEGLNNIELCEKLKLIIINSNDVQILLYILDTYEKQCALINALEIQNPNCEFMRHIDDFSNFFMGSKQNTLTFLFKKRTPQEWTRLIVKFDDFVLFLKMLRTHENKLSFINSNQIYLASLISTDTKLLRLFPYCNPKQLKLLLSHIQPTITQHWFQTPIKLQQLLRLTEGSYLAAKVRMILSVIPASLRITVLLQLNKTHFMLVDFLINTRSNLLDLYWESLAYEDWSSIFSDFNKLMSLIFKLMEFGISGPTVLESMIEKMPQSRKLQILTKINEEPEESNNKALLNIFKRNNTVRSQLYNFGLFKENEVMPSIEPRFKCARLTYN